MKLRFKTYVFLATFFLTKVNLFASQNEYWVELNNSSATFLTLRDDRTASFISIGTREDKTLFVLQEPNAKWGISDNSAILFSGNSGVKDVFARRCRKDPADRQIWVMTANARYDYRQTKELLCEVDKMGVQKILRRASLSN